MIFCSTDEGSALIWNVGTYLQNYIVSHHSTLTHAQVVPPFTCQFDVHLVIKKQILSLQISVNYILLMTVAHGCHDLVEDSAGFHLTHSSICN